MLINGYIDGDLLIYSGAARFNEEETFDKLGRYLDEELTYIKEDLALDDFTIFVTAGGNFRKEVYPEYKANRAKREKPRWLSDCYRYLYEEWAAEAKRTYEADDLLGIAVCADPTSILISYDKDLDQIPGTHYNWRKRKRYFVTEQEADYFLALQSLAGDPVDNIPGIRGIGHKRAAEILGGVGNPPAILLRYSSRDLQREERPAFYI